MFGRFLFMQWVNSIVIIVVLAVSLVIPARAVAFDEAYGAMIRTGPVASETSPNWRLCIGFGYENKKIAVFFGADMNVSVHTNGVNEDGEDLILNLSGIALDLGYKLVDLGSDFTFTVGSGFAWKTISYQAGSSSSFTPSLTLPNNEENPLGNAVHFGYTPYTQIEYRVSNGFAVLSRFGYDLNVGPDYQDITARSVSGFFLQLGLKLEFSPSDTVEF